MKSKHHTPEQVNRKLAEGDEMLNKGATVAEVARSFGITETTWYRWKNTYGGMKATDAKRRSGMRGGIRHIAALAVHFSSGVYVQFSLRAKGEVGRVTHDFLGYARQA